MGAIRCSVREFYEGAIEVIGFKSGLLLDRLTVRKLLLESFKDDYLNTDNLEEVIRIRSEYCQEKFTYIRKRIGNLSNELSTIKDMQLIMKYVKKTGDVEAIGVGTFFVLKEKFDNPNISFEDVLLKFQKSNPYPKEICHAMINIGWEQCDLGITLPNNVAWSGAKKLSDLFECEIKTENEHEYLEQQFLDYLAVNGSEIESIHWRNFERFCAQYFKRKGYEVILGPGTNDGGVDIRVIDTNSKIDVPPKLLIQCKRYHSENKVSIEAVKAFYADVEFENADHGLIATSGYIAPGGKKVCNTRGYNISFAENENVRNWAKEMWTYSPIE